MLNKDNERKRVRKVLMHYDTPTAIIEISAGKGGENAFKVNIIEILNHEHFPIGVWTHDLNKQKQHVNNFLSEFFSVRTMPYNRIGKEEALEGLGVETTAELALREYGFSFQDSYWVVDEDKTHLGYVETNPIRDTQLSRVSKFVGIEGFKGMDFSSISREKTIAGGTSGRLSKMWKWIIEEYDGKMEEFLVLYKGGDPNHHRQEVANELVATYLNKLFGFPHVEYDAVGEVDGIKLPHNVCKSFLDENQEMITMEQIIGAAPPGKPQEKKISRYMRGAEVLGIDPNVAVTQFAMRALVDYLVNNTDRHTFNEGVIRNDQSLNITGFVPGFDYGDSGWVRNSVENLYGRNTLVEFDRNGFSKRISARDGDAMPFAETHREQIELLKQQGGVDFLDDLDMFRNGSAQPDSILSILKRLEDELPDVFEHFLKQLPEFPQDRLEAVKDAVAVRATSVRQHIERL